MRQHNNLGFYLRLLIAGFLIVFSIIAHQKANASDYNRSEWRHWIDNDRDCQSTRHELLAEKSIRNPKFKTDDDCIVVGGLWEEPYANLTTDDPSDLDIEHIIPLKYAYENGGSNWSKALKKQFANDLLNLEVVDRIENRSRGAKGPSEWQPSNVEYHCEWAARQAVVLEKYKKHGLSYAPKDLFWIKSKLLDCL